MDRYEEALERAKSAYGSGAYDDETMRFIFPELAESEDERVIRTLYHLVEDHDWLNGATKDEVLAWLVKCKESLHISEMCKENASSFTDVSEDERIRKFLVTIVNNLSAPNFKEVDRKNVLAWLEKQKEASKAIEAVDRIDKYIDEHLANAHDMKDSNPDKKYYRGWDDALGKMAGILQDVYSEEKQEERKPEGVYVDCTEHPEWYGIPPKEQKPAEWSEEDEDNIKTLIQVVRGQLGLSECRQEYIVNWLKSLRPQQKVKLTELDENILEGAIAFVEQNDHFNYWRGVDKHTVLSALRSLRPQWKPSEEQMSILKKAVERYRNDWVGATIKEQNDLTSLYEQLKKLKSDEK